MAKNIEKTDIILKELRDEIKEIHKKLATIEKRLMSKKEKHEQRNKPVYAKSAFMIFSNEIKQKIVEDNPDAKPNETASIIKEKWKELDKKSKKTYSELAHKDKERFKREMEEMEEKVEKST